MYGFTDFAYVFTTEKYERGSETLEVLHVVNVLPRLLRGVSGCLTWEFPKIGEPYLGVLIIRILLFRVLYWGPLFSETPT